MVLCLLFLFGGLNAFAARRTAPSLTRKSVPAQREFIVVFNDSVTSDTVDAATAELCTLNGIKPIGTYRYGLRGFWAAMTVE
ncbi:MAG TPA: hypothetical protein VF911_17500, partial [Thermoanaerobaculia bacterium]